MNTPAFMSLTPMITGGNDLDATLAYYETKLGFAARFRDGDPTSFAIIGRGAVEIMFFRNDNVYLAEQTSFRIQVENVEALYAEYQAQDGSIIHPNGKLTDKPWGTREFAIIDLNGVCITFYERVTN